MVQKFTANDRLWASGRGWMAVGSGLALAGVALGAFGAHGLDGYLQTLAESDPELAAKRMANWQTAAHYQLIHALGILCAGILIRLQPAAASWYRVAAATFTLGVLIFSGMLYLLVLTEMRWLGAIVPIGGVGMILGWLAMAIASFRGGQPGSTEDL